MRRIATTVEQALKIAASSTSLGSGFPVYIIPLGIGNIPYEPFLCHQESDVRKIWEISIAPVKAPAFRRAHVIHCSKPPGPK